MRSSEFGTPGSTRGDRNDPTPALRAQADRRTRVGLAERIGRAIDAEIITAGMAPGSFLGREADLMARFGVSRPTLRTAIRQLEAANRVLTRPGVRGGLYVKDVSATAVMALAWHVVMLGQPLRVFFALHMPFFSRAAVLAAQRASAGDRARIAEIRDRMIAEPDRLQFFQVSRTKLRSAIFAACGNPALALVGSAFTQAYGKILRGELHLGETEQAKTARVKRAEVLAVSALLAGGAEATAQSCRAAARVEIAVTEETVRAGMVPERSVPTTLFASVRDGQQPDKLAEHVARAVRREIDRRQASPGVAIGSIPEIAARFGVSQDICREAMALLAGHGVVVLQRGRGGGVHTGRPTIAHFAHVLRRDLVEATGEAHIAELQAVLQEIRTGLLAEAAIAHEARPTVEFLDELLALFAAYAPWPG